LTVIVASREMMVSDSKVTIEHQKFTYPATKMVRCGEKIIGASGNSGDCTRFLRWAEKDFKGAEPKWAEATGSEDSVIGMVLEKSGIYLWNQGDPEPELVNAEAWAIGSGGKVARAAMILGLDPIKAAEMACQVDDFYCGLPLQIHRLEGK
jgi:hypothetical protein